MACHEIAGLRLGLMKLLGHEDEVERAHELAELGEQSQQPGPIQNMLLASNFADLLRSFEASLGELEHRVSVLPSEDPSLPYYRSLLIMTRLAELELRNHLESMLRFSQNLEQVHDFTHEVYPAR